MLETFFLVLAVLVLIIIKTCMRDYLIRKHISGKVAFKNDGDNHGNCDQSKEKEIQ